LAYRDAEARAAGPSVTISSDFAGKTYKWQGRIVRTEGEIDPQTRMVQALAQVENPYAQAPNSSRPPLAVGMFVQAEIVGRSVRAISLPRTALRGENVAWVINDRNQIEFRELDILRLEHDRVLIRGGVEPGERVCVSALEAAVQGMEVKVLEASGDAASD
jgi:multidrug efflux pump subunit AcrA (membrane-fusion protein)